jgi:enoyl-[acyl-carrier protein] reductase I
MMPKLQPIILTNQLKNFYFENQENKYMSIINVAGKKGIVFGVANEYSISYGCAKELHDSGAEIIMTYQNEKTEKYVLPLLNDMKKATLILCDVENEEQMEEVFQKAKAKWGTIDFVIHSIAFANKDDLHNPVFECSKNGFLQAMSISCHSFIKMTKMAIPMMNNGGTILTMTYYGSDKVFKNYNIMGPIKAALESSVRYIANEVADRGIKVFAISPGPIKTRAASGVKNIEDLVQNSIKKAPMQRLVTIKEVGQLATFLICDACSGMTGQTMFVDGGYHLVG